MSMSMVGIKARILQLISEGDGVHFTKIFAEFPDYYKDDALEALVDLYQKGHIISSNGVVVFPEETHPFFTDLTKQEVKKIIRRFTSY